MSNPDLPPGFRLVSGKQGPRNREKEYIVMFRRLNDTPFIDWHRTYTRDQLVWVHTGQSWDVLAVCEVGGETKKVEAARPANGSYA